MRVPWLAAVLVSGAVACGQLLGGTDVPSDPIGAGAPDGGGPDPNIDATAECGDADMQSNPANCGRCGRRCELGGCDAGSCEAYSLATDASAPLGQVSGLAVANGTLFIADEGIAGAGVVGGVARCGPLPSPGGACELGFIAVRPNTTGLALSGNGATVYFAAREVASPPTPGGVGHVAANAPVVSSPGAQGAVWASFDARKIAEHAGVLYVAETDGSLYSCTAAAKCEDLAGVPTFNQVRDVAADAQGVCVAGERAGVAGVYCGSSPTALGSASTLILPNKVVVDGDRVYFAGTGNAWHRVRRDGSSPAEPLNGMKDMTALAASGPDVYGASVDNGAGILIHRCADAACTATTILGSSPSLAPVESLVIGGEYLYFSTLLAEPAPLPLTPKHRLSRVPR